MKLSKLSENCPNWMDELYTFMDKHSSTTPSGKEINDIITTMDKAQVEEAPMDEDQICAECSKIEQCASSGTNYVYSSTWNKSDIAHLKEYTVACGMKVDRFIEAGKGKKRFCTDCHQPCSVHNVDGKAVSDCCDCSTVEKQPEARPEDNTEEVEASTAKTVKTAAVAVEKEVSLAEKLSAALGDPFHIDARSNTEKTDPSRSDWEKVTLAQKLGDQPVMSSGIIPLRGGEDYNKNSETNRTAPGQNSISAPDAIEKLATSKTIDTGVRLKKEREAREASVKMSHAEWQKKNTPEFEVAKGVVFPTETLTAQTGLNQPSSQMGVYAKFDPASIPEFTEGEKITQANKDRKQSIQREKPENDWESPRHQSSRSVSDTFGESLKKYLKGK